MKARKRCLCGTPLPPRKHRWCREKCREWYTSKPRLHPDPCVDCGGPRTKVSKARCGECFVKHRADQPADPEFIARCRAAGAERSRRHRETAARKEMVALVQGYRQAGRSFASIASEIGVSMWTARRMALEVLA